MEYDDEQRCFILKDLNSSTGTYVHDCRVQNAAVRLADGDLIRFGFNGLPLEFRIESQQQEVWKKNVVFRKTLFYYRQQCRRYIKDNQLPILFNLSLKRFPLDEQQMEQQQIINNKLMFDKFLDFHFGR
jgi:pSer/pThr/pTyr-binding forkhead associated (FHA) protein